MDAQRDFSLLVVVGKARKFNFTTACSIEVAKDGGQQHCKNRTACFLLDRGRSPMLGCCLFKKMSSTVLPGFVLRSLGSSIQHHHVCVFECENHIER